MKKGNPIALLPIGVFLVLYLGLGLLFEYGLHIPMGFYNIPIVIAFLVSILVACLQNRAVPFEEKLVIMGQGVGGAMFGDNLSFISDTTIAACNGQGCAMKDKFKGNFWIALPAAIATLVLILLLTMGHDTAPIDEHYDLLQIIPYVLVLAGGVAGINVFIVLLTGIVSGAVIMLLTGQVEATALLASMGNGAAGMFETSMVAILVAAMCALIRVYGGFDALLSFIRKVFRGKKGGQLGMGLLVGCLLYTSDAADEL